MDADELQKACWSAAKAPRPNRVAMVRPIVATDPDRSWALLRRWVREAASEEDADACWPVLRSLLDLDGGWETTVASVVVDDRRLADCLDAALADDPARFDRLVSREQLVETWLRYRAEGSPWDFWAVGLVYAGTHRWGTDGLWSLVVDLADRCDDTELLVALGEHHLDEFVFLDPQSAIECIERRAPNSARLRQALWYVDVADLPDDVAARLRRVAEPPPGTSRRG